MDLDVSGDDNDDSTESESGDDDNSTESESGDDDNSTESVSKNYNNSTESSTTEDVWDDMILEIYNTEDYATKSVRIFGKRLSKYWGKCKAWYARNSHEWSEIQLIQTSANLPSYASK